MKYKLYKHYLKEINPYPLNEYLRSKLESIINRAKKKQDYLLEILNKEKI